MNPFAIVAACAAVVVDGHVWSLFHAARASAVPSGNGEYGARIVLCPLVRDRGQPIDHVLRQRVVARLPVVHDHGAVLQVVDGVRLVDRLRVDPRRDRERGRVVISRGRRMVRIRGALAGLQMQTSRSARGRRLHVAAPRRLGRRRSRPPRRAAGWPRAGRTTRCRRPRRRSATNVVTRRIRAERWARLRAASFAWRASSLRSCRWETVPPLDGAVVAVDVPLGGGRRGFRFFLARHRLDDTVRLARDALVRLAAVPRDLVLR